jgi:membrane-anchored glycerophosphoryl diester phosphodiesterase (GDPDase)
MTVKAKPSKAKKVKEREKDSLGFTKRNYYLFALGLVVIVLGFITLRMGSITLAPILLVLGYCVIIPLSIIVDWKRKRET